jgi:hypothetical protein
MNSSLRLNRDQGLGEIQLNDATTANHQQPYSNLGRSGLHEDLKKEKMM